MRSFVERQRITRQGEMVSVPARHDAMRSISHAEGMAAKVLGMQQALGNQAVQQRASTCPAFPSACPTGGACHTCPARVQAKLIVNEPGDSYEQEADRVAEAVMRMPEPQHPESGKKEKEIIQTKPITEINTPIVQRQGEEDQIREISTGFLSSDETRKVIEAGEKWINTPYKYGGNSKDGIDCSHFVHRAYTDAGFPYEYLSTSTFTTSPKFVEQKEPATANVALFTGHMGIYNPNPSKAGWTILSARTTPGVGVNYGKPGWYGVPRYFRYQKSPIQEKSKKVIQKKHLNNRACREILPINEIYGRVIHGSGQHLPETVRSFFEPRFGYDFSQVRVHTDTQAAKLAQAVNALAFTVGREIVFGAGRYVPGTATGKKLLAHELTHVVQQGMPKTAVASSDRRPSNPSGLSEREADRTANQMMSGQPKRLIHSTALAQPNRLLRAVDYDECTSAEETIVLDSHNRAMDMVTNAVTKLGSYNGTTPANVRKALDTHFHSSGTGLAGRIAYNLD